MLGFRAGLQVLGFWIALASAALLQTCVFTIVIARLDWNVEVRRAGALIGSKSLDYEAVAEAFEGLPGEEERQEQTEPLLSSYS